MIIRHPLFCLLFCLPGLLSAQADELPTMETFRGIRLINGQSVETLPQGALNFSVAHRFSYLDGLQTFFGLDGTSNFRLGLAYGISDRATIGIGRSRLGKRVDGFAKYRFLVQQQGMPLSASVLLGSTIGTEAIREEQQDYFLFDHRLTYLSQLLLARKVGFRWSFQLAPTMVHRNLVEYDAENNTTYAVGTGLRFQMLPRTALTAEYYYRINPGQHPTLAYRNPIALSMDIETDKHRFQLQFTNAFSLLESGFIPETTGNIGVAEFRFGFNISRIF